MSSEVCPFCGKTYKRLKSHLPHCKAAGSSETPPAKRDVAAKQTSSSSQLAAAAAAATSSQPKAGEEKSTHTLPVTASPQSKKGTKISSVSSSVPASASSLSPSTPPSSVLASSPTKKKKKEKLSDQIKTAKTVSSTSLGSSPSPPPPSNVSEPKRKSLRALIEAAKSKRVSVGSGEGTRSASDDLPSASAPPGTDSLNSLNIQTETETNLDEDTRHPVFLSQGSKPKVKATRTKKATPSPLPINETSPDSEVNDRAAKSRLSGGLWVETDVGGSDLSVSEMFSKSESSPRVRITLRDVKATLGRANNRPHDRPSVLSQIRAGDLSGGIRPALPTGSEEGNLVSTQTPSNELSSNSSRSTERQSATTRSSESTEATSTPLRHRVSPQPGLPEASVLSGYLSSQVNKATPPLPAVRASEALKAGRRHTGLLPQPPSLAHALRLPPQTLPAREETLRFGDGPQLEVRRQKNTAGNGAKGALTERGLGQVRLRELPEWLACKTPSHPRDVVHMVQRGWQWYYKRYIDVRKGGVGGVGMLLAGYCVLSYIWSYPHIKRDRWRKHH
ncbi:uncharacterized protein C17orf80 homolog [Labrus mixtus]|uniref:uncharacterized protein C17orf80 homolog n=1 Tax=Labrus mixtus TaxID=508554 RepID=UPI0029C04EB3|nr:uncharacterized protein C17orf80 homolog [Labrus mixtus]